MCFIFPEGNQVLNDQSCLLFITGLGLKLTLERLAEYGLDSDYVILDL